MASAYRGKIPQHYLDGLDPTHRAQAWRQIIGEADPSRGGTLVAVGEGGGISGLRTSARPGTAMPIRW